MPTLLTPDGLREGGVRCTYSDGIIEREEDWHYDVLADDIRQSRSDILFNTPGLPKIGIDIIDNMLVKGGDAQRNPDKVLRWRVSLTLSNNVDQNDANNAGQQQGDPTLWVPARRTMWESKSEFRDTDASGKKLQNSAKTKFETPMSIKRHCLAWEFVQFDPLSVTDTILLLRNEVLNSQPWPAFDPKPARTWFCRVLDSEVGFYAGFRCRRTLYRIAYDEFRWTDKRLDVGQQYLSGTTQLPYLINGVQGYFPLDGSGGRRRSESGAPIGSGDPETIEFDPFPVRDFGPWFRLQA